MPDFSYSRIIIIGSGGNGISAGVYLKKAGIDDFIILSKSSDFGGTWHENRYPGLEVDIPSRVYQFTYAPNPDWTSRFAGQPELLRYMRRVAAEHDLGRHARFHTEMSEARWLDEEAQWEILTTKGTFRAKYLVVATGFLDEAKLPDIEGIDSFRGRIFHSSQWPEGYLGEDERVAVVGSGASAIQIVPELQKHARSLIVFARTPTWILPKPNRHIPAWEKALLRSFPPLHRLYCRMIFRHRSRHDVVGGSYRLGDGFALMEQSLAFLKSQVLDPALREKLTPKHHFGCKRPLFSDTYLKSLTRPNVTVVTEAASAIGKNSIRSQSGKEFGVDTIVLTTGYAWGDTILSRIRRRDGRSVAEFQDGWSRAYKAISVSGCPNLFLLGGAAPNGQRMSGLITGEAGARYIVKFIRHVEAQDVDALEVKEEAELEWKRGADRILDNGPTVAGGCVNYSQDAFGHNKAAWPGSTQNMLDELSVIDASAYAPVVRAAAATGSALSSVPEPVV